MARCSSWCRSTSPTRPGRSPAWSARWAASAASSRRCCSASSATAWARSGRASCCWPRLALLLVVGQPAGLPAAAGGARDSRCPPSSARTADRVRAGAWATLWTALLVAAIVVGSRNLQNFDPALVIYTFAVDLRHLGRRLPLQRLAARSRRRACTGERGWELVPAAGHRRAVSSACCRLAGRHLVGADASSRTRSRLRWWMHQLPLLGLPAGGRRSPFRWSSAGSTSAALPGDQLTYVTYLFGFPDGIVPAPHRRRRGCSSTAWTSRRSWCWPASRSRSGAG